MIQPKKRPNMTEELLTVTYSINSNKLNLIVPDEQIFFVGKMWLFSYPFVSNVFWVLKNIISLL